VARFSVRAPPYTADAPGKESGGMAHQRGGAVGSGRRDGVPVEGGSSGVVVMRLEVEAKGDYGHGVGAEKKNMSWGVDSASGGAVPV
jgi:hypothetical protein